MINDKDDWVDELEDLPLLDPKFENCSRDVQCMLADGTVVEGYYAYHLDGWRYAKNSFPIKQEVVKWRDK